VGFADDVVRVLIAKRRGDHQRLWFALQLATLRRSGTFRTDPPNVPHVVVEYLAGQLGGHDPSGWELSCHRPKTPFERTWEIQKALGLVDSTSADDDGGGVA